MKKERKFIFYLLLFIILFSISISAYPDLEAMKVDYNKEKCLNLLGILGRNICSEDTNIWFEINKTPYDYYDCEDFGFRFTVGEQICGSTPTEFDFVTENPDYSKSTKSCGFTLKDIFENNCIKYNIDVGEKLNKEWKIDFIYGYGEFRHLSFEVVSDKEIKTKKIIFYIISFTFIISLIGAIINFVLNKKRLIIGIILLIIALISAIAGLLIFLTPIIF